MDRLKNFFLFRLMEKFPRPVKRDEPSMLSKCFCMIALLLIAIDMAVIVFFVRTSARLDLVAAHNYTQRMNQSTVESTKVNKAFAANSKDKIKQKSLRMREYLSKIQFDKDALSDLRAEDAVIPELTELRNQLKALETGPGKNLQAAIESYKRAEIQLKELNNRLNSLTVLRTNVNHVEQNLKLLLDDINNTMNEFYMRIVELSDTQNKNQKALHFDLINTMQAFNSSLSSLVRQGREVRLNNVFNYEFIEFDRDYVPFLMDFKSRTGTWMTKSTVLFRLRLPRVYHCSLQAYMESNKSFFVGFEFVDLGDNSKEAILYKSAMIRGGFKLPVTFDEIFSHTLGQGVHKLALRVVSEFPVGSIRITHKKFSCLSYRHFVS